MMKRPHLSLIPCALATAATLAFAPPAAALNLGTQPLYLGGSIPPIVMLLTPKDHQLFKKAYDDFSDLDSTLPGGDTALEIGYKHSVDYYGYFDPFKCYTYSSATGRFEPSVSTANKYCAAGTAWSGNFLNWVTMSRIDVMRRLLFGGFRSTDTSGTTVLERALIPTEAHAWAKHYRGADVRQLVPFSASEVLTAPRTVTSTSSVSFTTTGSRTFSVSNSAALNHPLINGDQVTVCRTSNPTQCMFGEVTTEDFGGTADVIITMHGQAAGNPGGSFSGWTITNHSSTGISFCNTTQATTGTSHASTAVPLVRVAAGDFTLWGVGDGTACRWSDEGGGPNGNRRFDTEMDSNRNAAKRDTSAATHLNNGGVANGDYRVRVLVCSSTLIGTERCTQYPNGNLKPTGLLQDYATGQNKKIKFGLFTGSYEKNKSGGVLRRNPGFLDSATSANPSLFNNTVDELDAGTGIFNNAVTGIIKSFNSIKLYGYTFAAGTGFYSAADGCGLLSPDPTEGDCTSWGNPLSEMFVETLRYLAGRSPTPAFTYTEGAGQKDFDIGLRQPAWVNQLTSANFCTPLNVIMMNASVNSYDNDQVPSDLFPSGTTATTLTNTVGGATYENIVGNYLIGNSGSVNNGLCSSKAVGAAGAGFGNLFGICPEAPALRGSYQMVGAAHWAKTNRIRSDITVPATDTRALKVTTYGIALASAVPTIQIPVPGTSPARFVTIQPTARTFNGATDRGHGSIVDFKVIRQDHAAGTGKFFVSWEDSTQGNDYDLDMWGFISYRFVSGNSQIEVTSDVVYAAAGHSIAFGYVISGTAGNDGAHFHSAHEGNRIISYHFPTGFNTNTTGNNECNDCSQPNPPSARVYTLSAAGSSSSLKEPLWYTAKYGGFIDQNSNNKPDLVQEWDSKNNLTGADGNDGNPDTYFPVTNPGSLEGALDRAFISVLQVSSASSVATNSTSLQSGSTVYQARFNANEWSGQLLAFGISTTGAIDPVPLWDASQLLPSASARTILTFNRDTTFQYQAGSPKGIPFRWANLNTLQQADLNKNALGTPDPAGTECTGATLTGFTPAGCTRQGRMRLDWLRGDAANEGATATKYRVRPTTKLGDIVNSTPIYVGPASSLQYGDFSPPAAAYGGDTSYDAFVGRPEIAGRTPTIYAAGNDGMLHGFDASTGLNKGVETLAYVPSTAYRHFTKLTDKTYSHRYYVDGSPTVADVKFGDGTWHTILVGGLSAGGQGIYALDITDPAGFSEGNASNLVLWEWTDHNDDWLGNTYSQPSVAKMANGRFAVIFGNGYNASIGEAGDTRVDTVFGCASLTILFVDGGIDGVWSFGTDFTFIDVLVSCNPANPNGLATPRVVDVNNDGVADYIYAGDLRGNLWKFDVRNPSPGSWALANGTTPLFSARDAGGNPQPITAAPTTFPHTTPGTTMVLFGTGKYLEQTDDSPPFLDQSFYGIWDKHDGTTVSSRSQLLKQKVLGATSTNPLGVTIDNPATTGVDEGGFRITTPYKPNYTAAPRINTQFGESNASAQDEFATSPAHRGWYMDFPFSGDSGALTPGTGERVVFRPIITTGKLVFTTLVPSTQACQFGGTSFLMDLDPVSGSRLAVSPFDVNNDNNFTGADFVLDPAGNPVAVSGRASTIGIVPTPTVIQMTPSTGPGTPGKEVKVLSGSSGQLISVLELGAAPTLPGAAGRRILWRQLFTD
ncbi:MAG TPA: PilC/PilY family type IV pilus protein [Burkholderiales bacterium]|nr:PilC/PilY family type IV pilus protein [Burkholderiales bacterium]